MPSNWLYIDSNFPAFTGEESTDEKVSTIQNYMYMLVEQLRYTLHNLDLTNMNAPAVRRFTGTLTAPIYAAIRDADENITQLAVTASGIAARVGDAEGNISALQQTAKNLSVALQDTAGNISALQLTAKSLSTTVSNQAGQISSLQQTASSLSTTVSNQTGQISSLQQTVKGFSLSVSNGSASSTVALRSNGVTISSANISMSGMVTFSDLSTSGRTTINGGNINTGTIIANNVGVSNRFSVYSGDVLRGYMGCGYGHDGSGYTYGAMLASANDSNYLIATNAGVRMTGGGSSLYCVNGSVHATSELVVDSDRRVKADIDYDLKRYEAFFSRLRPCVYRRRAERVGRLHSGFVAQDVEEALGDAGLGYADFAALVKDPGLDPEYSLAYGEFAALNTYMIQKLMRRVEELELSVGTRWRWTSDREGTK